MNRLFNAHIKDSDVSIEPSIPVETFGKVKAFEVKVTCNPAYEGSDKELMNEVCKILYEQTNRMIELKTFYVIHDACFVGKHRRIETIVFQVITPLETQWHS